MKTNSMPDPLDGCRDMAIALATVLVLVAMSFGTLVVRQTNA